VSVKEDVERIVRDVISDRGSLGLPTASLEPIGSGLDQYESQVPDKCMVVKTITIDMEAYEILSRFKRWTKIVLASHQRRAREKENGSRSKARHRTHTFERGCRRCHRSSNPRSAAQQSPGSEAVIRLDPRRPKAERNKVDELSRIPELELLTY